MSCVNAYARSTHYRPVLLISIFRCFSLSYSPSLLLSLLHSLTSPVSLTSTLLFDLNSNLDWSERWDTECGPTRNSLFVSDSISIFHTNSSSFFLLLFRQLLFNLRDKFNCTLYICLIRTAENNRIIFNDVHLLKFWCFFFFWKTKNV